MKQAATLTDTQSALLDLLANALFDAKRPIADGLDWNSIFLEARHQSVAGVVFSSLPRDRMPDSVYKEWSNFLDKVVADNMRVSWEHCELNSLMTAAEIPYVIMKGCVSALYYPDPIMRSMGDVDFLVDKNNVTRAGELLEKEGFIKPKYDHACEISYCRMQTEDSRKSIWELHWEPNGVPGGDVGKLTRHYLSDVIKDAKEVHTDDGTYMRPSEFHHGLIMTLHTARHMITSGIGLRHLCDWAVFVNSMPEEEFVNLFEEKMKSIGLWRFVQLLTQASVDYLCCPKKERIGTSEPELVSYMLLDIFEGGNFGRKNKCRTQSGRLITNRKKGRVDDSSMLKQAVLSANEIVRLHWPVADKIVVLYPIGWAFFGLRYFVRMILGKRNRIDVGGMIREAEKRKPIYQQFHLFERQ